MTSFKIIKDFLIGKEITLHIYDSTYDGKKVFQTDYVANKYRSHGEKIIYKGKISTTILDVLDTSKLDYNDLTITVDIIDKEHPKKKIKVEIQLRENLTIK